MPILSRSHDLVIQARVDGKHLDQTLNLIHREHLGFEYWDKALCVLPVGHFSMLRDLMEDSLSLLRRRRAGWRLAQSGRATDQALGQPSLHEFLLH